MAETDSANGYQAALSQLIDAGVFNTENRFRDGHTAAIFDGAAVDITGSTLTQREVSEKDRMQLFGHLLAVAAERGLKPAELLVIGLAHALRGEQTPSIVK